MKNIVLLSRHKSQNKIFEPIEQYGINYKNFSFY